MITRHMLLSHWIFYAFYLVISCKLYLRHPPQSTPFPSADDIVAQFYLSASHNASHEVVINVLDIILNTGDYHVPLSFCTGTGSMDHSGRFSCQCVGSVFQKGKELLVVYFLRRSNTPNFYSGVPSSQGNTSGWY